MRYARPGALVCASPPSTLKNFRGGFRMFWGLVSAPRSGAGSWWEHISASADAMSLVVGASSPLLSIHSHGGVGMFEVMYANPGRCCTLARGVYLRVEYKAKLGYNSSDQLGEMVI